MDSCDCRRFYYFYPEKKGLVNAPECEKNKLFDIISIKRVKDNLRMYINPNLSQHMELIENLCKSASVFGMPICLDESKEFFSKGTDNVAFGISALNHNEEKDCVYFGELAKEQN